MAPPTLFDNDWFAGVRLLLNDPADTQILAGTLIDVEDGSRLFSVEAQRRIGRSLIAALQARFFSNTHAQNPENAFASDDFIDISVRYHF